jgi:hypothetical protein
MDVSFQIASATAIKSVDHLLSWNHTCVTGGERGYYEFLNQYTPQTRFLVGHGKQKKAGLSRLPPKERRPVGAAPSIEPS